MRGSVQWSGQAAVFQGMLCMSYYLLGFRLWLDWALSMKYPPSKYSAITKVILVYVSDTYMS